MSTGLFDVLALQGIAFPHTNSSSEATVGFEVKDSKDTMYVHITESTFDTDAYISFALGTYSKTVTAAQAKTLQGVNVAEVITVYCEMYADDLSGSREASLQIEFFNESGDKQGDTTELSLSTAAEWDNFAQAIVVPTGATRVNFYLHAGCGTDETVQVWCANMKITRA